MSKSLCHDCRHNCTDHKTKSCINYKGIWCNVEYGRVIKKKIKGCKDYERREKMSHIGIGGNLIQPNKQCLSCKYWEPASKSYLGFSIGGGCKVGYCKKRSRKK